MSIKKGDLIHVRWIDSCETYGWLKALDDSSPARCETVGWVRHNDRRTIVLASSRGLDTNNACGHITIPRSCVKRIRQIKEPK